MINFITEKGFTHIHNRAFDEAGQKITYEYYKKEYTPYERDFDYGPMIYKSSIIYSPIKNSLRVEMWNHKMLDYECYFDGKCENEEHFNILCNLLDLR